MARLLSSDTFTFTTEDGNANITLPAGTDCLVVQVCKRDPASSDIVINGVTIEGNALTAVGTRLNTGAATLQPWYRVGSFTTGTPIALAVDTAAAASWTVRWSAYSGVHQSTTIGAVVTNQSVSSGMTASTNALATSVDGLVVDLLLITDQPAGSLAPGANQAAIGSSVLNTDGDYETHASRELSNGGTVTMSWSWSTNKNWAHYVFELIGAPVSWTPEMSDDFTGTNGNPPDAGKWAVSGTGPNSGITIQSNALQLAVTGTPAGFVEPKVLSTPGTGNVQDGRLDCDTTVGAGRLFHNLKVRVSAEADDEIRVGFSRTADGNSLDVRLIKEVNNVLTTIHEQLAIAADVSSQWLVRHEIIGDIMRYAVRPFAGGAIPEGSWDGQGIFTEAELAVLSPVQINLASDEAATVVVDNVVISVPGLTPPSSVVVDAAGAVTWVNGETERLKAYAQKQAGSGLTYTLAVFDSTETQPLQVIDAVTAPEGAGTYDIWLTHFTGDPEDPTLESAPSNVDTFVVGTLPETPVLATPTINGNGNPALSVSSGGGDTTDIDLERSPAGAGTWTVIHTFGVFGGVFEDTTAAADTAFDYRAVATGPGGTATSNVETITVPPDPPTTGSFTATSFHGGTVTHDLNTAGTTTEAVEVTLQWPEDSFVFTIPLSATVPFTVPFVLDPSTAYTPTFRSVGVDGNSAAFVGTADTTDVAGATPILLRVDDHQNPSAGDVALFNLIAAAPDGFSPVYVSYDQYPSLAPYDVVIVTPGGPNTEDLDDTIATLGKPVLVLRYALALLLADLGATTGESTTQITITDDTHPLAAGFPAGALTVLSAANNISGTTDAGLCPGAETVARRGVGATHWALFWVPQGGELANASLAPAARAAFLLNDDASLAALSANGETIVLNAVRELLPVAGVGSGRLVAAGAITGSSRVIAYE